MGGLVYGYASIEPILLFYSTVPLVDSVFFIMGQLLLTWGILFGLVEIFSRLYFRRNEGNFALLNGIGLALFPLFLLPTIMTLNQLGNLGLVFEPFWITIILLVMLAVSFATLRLWLSFWAEITAIIAWGILLFQGRK